MKQIQSLILVFKPIDDDTQEVIKQFPITNNIDGAHNWGSMEIDGQTLDFEATATEFVINLCNIYVEDVLGYSEPDYIIINSSGHFDHVGRRAHRQGAHWRWV